MQKPGIGGLDFGEADFVQSGFCTGGHCFKWLELDDVCLLQDSKNEGTEQPTIAMSRSTWESVKAHFMSLDTEVPTSEAADTIQFDSVAVTMRADGWADVIDASTNVVLSYNPEEIRDFISGLLAKDFVAIS